MRTRTYYERNAYRPRYNLIGLPLESMSPHAEGISIEMVPRPGFPSLGPFSWDDPVYHNAIYHGRYSVPLDITAIGYTTREQAAQVATFVGTGRDVLPDPKHYKRIAFFLGRTLYVLRVHGLIGMLDEAALLREEIIQSLDVVWFHCMHDAQRATVDDNPGLTLHWLDRRIWGEALLELSRLRVVLQTLRSGVPLAADLRGVIHGRTGQDDGVPPFEQRPALLRAAMVEARRLRGVYHCQGQEPDWVRAFMRPAARGDDGGR